MPGKRGWDGFRYTIVHTDPPPCKGCQDREMGCHSICHGYIDWKAKHEHNLDGARKQRLDESDVVAHTISTIEKNSKRGR